jgi:hypothetical protein
MSYGNAELDACKDRYWPPDARVSISTVQGMLDDEKKRDLERLEQEREDRLQAAIVKQSDKQRKLETQRRSELQAKRETMPYSDAIAQEICLRVSSGELLIDICENSIFPTARRVTEWLKDNQEFHQVFNLARMDRLTIFEESIVKISDNMNRDVITLNGREVINSAAVARDKVRIEVRMKHLKAGKPNIWGDMQTIVNKTDDNDVSNLSDAELEKRMRDIEVKSRIMRGVKGDLPETDTVSMKRDLFA